MKTKNLYVLAGLVLLTVALVALPGPARSEMFFEVFGGGAAGLNTPNDYTTGAWPYGSRYGTDSERHHMVGSISPHVLGGVRVGYWFSPTGFLGRKYPKWMQYFGIGLDFSYQKLNYPKQSGNSFAVATYPYNRATPTYNVFWSEGSLFNVSFLLMARYGFIKSQDFPSGRLIPFLGVGPTLSINSQSPNFRFPDAWGCAHSAKLGSETDVALGLMAEAGLRWMALKNVFIGFSFTYRYTQHSFYFSYHDPQIGNPNHFTWWPTLHLFGGRVMAGIVF